MADPELLLRPPNARRGFVATALAVGGALLPALTCPACLGPYASLLAMAGVSFGVLSTAFSALFFTALAVGLGTVGLATLRHRSPWPLALTFLGCLAFVADRLVAPDLFVRGAGIALLVAGSVWSFRLQRVRAACAVRA